MAIEWKKIVFENDSPTFAELNLAGKLTAGAWGSPIDVTATRKYGFELHYSGNNYDVFGIRSRANLITTDASTRTAVGAELQAANTDGIDVGVLNGCIIEAIGKSDANAATISTMRGVLIGTEWGNYDTVTNLKTLHVRGHSRNAVGAGSFGTGYGIYIENEAVGGNGQALDAGIYFKDTNIVGDAFNIGIDFSGATYTTADIKLSGGVITSTSGSLTLDGIITTTSGTFLINNIAIDDIGSKNLRVGYDTTEGDAGEENTFIGYEAGENLDATTIPIPEAAGCKNTYVGARAGKGSTEGEDNSGSENTGIGCESLRDNTTGYENTGVGDEALRRNTTGHGNCAFGNDSLEYNTTGNFNSAFGADALYVNTEGGHNVAVGYQCLYSNTTASYNIAMGYQCLYNNTTEPNNVAIGYQAGYNDTGSTVTGGNIIIGYRACYKSIGEHNVIIGYEAGRLNDDGGAGGARRNVYIGYWAGYGTSVSDNSGHSNVAIGYKALAGNTEGSSNVAIGSEALLVNSCGGNNFAIGAGALKANTTGTDNLAIGYLALNTNETGGYNIAIGASALKWSTTSRNIGIGYETLLNVTAGKWNTAIGYQAGRAGTTKQYSTYIGYLAGSNNDGEGCVSIGFQAGYAISGDYCINIGFCGGRNNTSANRLIIGNQLYANEATEIANSIIYGVMDTVAASQSLRINAATLTLNGGADTDITVNFTGTTNSGVMSWMEDEDYFKFADDVLIDSAEKINLRDTAIGIYSQADTYMDLFADGGIRIGDSSAGAPTNYANIAPDGEVTLVGTARVMKHIFLDNADLGKGTTAPSQTIIGNYTAWEFDVDDDCVVDFIVPSDWDSSTDIDIEVCWYIDEAYATNSGEIRWQAAWSACPHTSTEAIDAPTHTGTDNSGDINIPATAKYLTETTVETIPAASLSAGDDIGITFSRVAIGDGSNPVADPGVTHIKIKYTSNCLGGSL